MLLILQLLYEFAKAGLFAVGGGLATLPFLQEMARNTGWFTAKDIADLVAISESTPGPLGVNMATYVGYKTLGIGGGFVSTIGLILPSIIIIIIVAQILDKFRDAPAVQKVFYGLRPASTALITVAGLGVAKIALLNLDAYTESGNFMDALNIPCMILGVVLYVLMKYLPKQKINGKKLNLHPVVYIAFAAVIGVICKL